MNPAMKLMQISSSIHLESKYRKMREDYENWLCLVVWMDSAGKRLCYEILHTKEQQPVDGAQLYERLQKYKNNMHYQIYEEVLCPSNKIIDEKKFDLLVYTVVIHFMFGIKYKELLQDVRDMRNKIFHMKDVSFCSTEFEQLWSDACKTLRKPGFHIELPNILWRCDMFSVEEYRGICQSIFNRKLKEAF